MCWFVLARTVSFKAKLLKILDLDIVLFLHSHAQTDTKNRLVLVKSCGMLAGTTLAVGRLRTTGTVSRTLTVWTTTGPGCPGPRV